MTLLPAYPSYQTPHQTLYIVTWQTPAQDEDADLLAHPGILPRAGARDAADRGLRRSPLAGAAGLGAGHMLQAMPETVDAVMEPDVDELHDSCQPSGDLGMQASLIPRVPYLESTISARRAQMSAVACLGSAAQMCDFLPFVMQR